jgi:hypothetical protein
MSSRSLWYIVTPVYKPAPGGGAIYTDILARALAGEGADVIVETEGFEGQPRYEQWRDGQGSITIDRRYPLRAGRPVRDWRSYLAYAAQNLIMLGMARRLARAARIKRYDSVVVLVHCSLLYNRTVLPSLLGQLRKAHSEASLVIDVRDPTFGADLAPQFACFDAAVGCSQGVANKLRGMLQQRVPVAHIPMPFEHPEPPSDEEVAATLARHGLARGRYLFNPNGIANGKHYPVMREAVSHLRRRPGFEDVVLVTAGRQRDRTALDDEAEARGDCRYIGLVGQEEALALMRGAMMTLVLSKQESISRAALEAMSVGGRVLLPDLEEFRGVCAGHICADVAPQSVAESVAALSEVPTPAFEFENHSRERFVPAYLQLATGGRRRG